jgi:molecular chaperone GrpE
MPSSHASEEQEHAPPEPDLAEQLAATEDRFKRALADLDNYRKRAGRETDRRVAEAREALLRDFLEAVDSLERASTLDPALAEGLGAVMAQLQAILARHGVHRIGEAGEPFDPERHEAVAVRRTGEAPERTVLDVARSGYAVDGRVLRPAEVTVAQAPDG